MTTHASAGEFVEVYNSPDNTHLRLVASLLESEGFTCLVVHETLNQVFGGMTDITQGTSLLVPQSEVHGARALLIDKGYLPSDKLSPEALPVGLQSRHSHLGTHSIGKQLLYITTAILILLLVLGLYIYFLDDTI